MGILKILSFFPFALMLGLVGLVHMAAHRAFGRTVYATDEQSSPDLDLSFAQTSVWARFAVVLAGPAANFLLAVLLFWGLLAFGSGSAFPHISTSVGQVISGSPAAAGGIRTGDRIVAINGKPVSSWEELAGQVPLSGGQVVRLRVEQAGGDVEIVLTTRAPSRQAVGDPAMTLGSIGISRSEGFSPNRLRPLFALTEAAKTTAGAVGTILTKSGKIIVGAVSPHMMSDGIPWYEMTGVQLQLESLPRIIFLIGYLSIILGLVNLFPLPFLDGGRLCFLLIEMVRGRPVSLARKRVAQWVAVFLLLGWVIVTVYLAHYDQISRFLKTL